MPEEDQDLPGFEYTPLDTLLGPDFPEKVWTVQFLQEDKACYISVPRDTTFFLACFTTPMEAGYAGLRMFPQIEALGGSVVLVETDDLIQFALTGDMAVNDMPVTGLILLESFREINRRYIR